MAAYFTVQEVLQATSAQLSQVGRSPGFGAIQTDTRLLSSQSLFVALIGERFDAHEFLLQACEKGAAGLVVKRGHPRPSVPKDVSVFEVDDTLVAYGALGRHHRRRFELPLCAITGSNGKTTSKEMVASILATRGPVLKTQGNLNNEVGVPQTLLGLEPVHVSAVIEMGMNHLGEIARLVRLAEPKAALITCVQPAHLEGVGSLENVALAKGEIFEGLADDAVAVVNLDDVHVSAQARKARGRRLTYGEASNADVRLVRRVTEQRLGQRLTVSYDERSYEVRLAFLGEHNARNATGAFALALALGWSPEECVKGLDMAAPHDRRLSLKPGLNGVAVLDDCYNANPASMEAALKTVRSLCQPGRAVAVLGDMLELGSHETQEHVALGEKTAQHVDFAAFFGPRAQKSYEAAKATGTPCAHFVEVEALLAWLLPQLKAGDMVLVKGSRGMRLERVVQALTGERMGEAH